VKEEITETAAWSSLEGIAAAARVVDDVIKAALGPVFAQARSLAVAWDYITTLSAQFDYALTKAWTLGVGYMFEKYDYKDPYTVLNNELLPVSTIIFMKPNDGKYSANLLFASVKFHF